jgi:hypothetical protein
MRWPISAHKNSLQSRLSSIFTEPFPSEPLDPRDPLLERESGYIFAIELRGCFEAIGYADDAFNRDQSIAE